MSGIGIYQNRYAGKSTAAGDTGKRTRGTRKSAAEEKVAMQKTERNKKAEQNEAVPERKTINDTDILELSEEGRRAQELSSAGTTQDKKQTFTDTKELMNYLWDNYRIVNRGMASISRKFLNDCLTDESKLKKLFENLALADKMDADAKENVKGYQGMTVSIDENGDMKTESYSGWVEFNEGKRARQLAAAKTQAHVQTLLGILQADLEQCEAGKERGMCDDETIARVKAMIMQAQQKMGEVAGKQDEEESFADDQAFLMAGLL